MAVLQFLDKRDKNDLLSGYSINGFAYNLAEKNILWVKKFL